MDWDQIAIMTVVPSFICVFGSLFFFCVNKICSFFIPLLKSQNNSYCNSLSRASYSSSCVILSICLLQRDICVGRLTYSPLARWARCGFTRSS